jgi:hypothetical protein
MSIFADDSCNDFALFIEIFYEKQNVALIRQEKNGISFRWYAYKGNLIVPFEWLFELIDRMVKVAQEDNRSQGFSNNNHKDRRVLVNL